MSRYLCLRVPSVVRGGHGDSALQATVARWLSRRRWLGGNLDLCLLSLEAKGVRSGSRDRESRGPCKLR